MKTVTVSFELISGNIKYKEQKLCQFYRSITNQNRQIIEEKSKLFEIEFISEDNYENLKFIKKEVKKEESILEETAVHWPLRICPKSGLKNTKNIYKSKLKSSLKNTPQINFD